MKRRSFFASVSALLGLFGLGSRLPAEAAVGEEPLRLRWHGGDMIRCHDRLGSAFDLHRMLWKQLHSDIASALSEAGGSVRVGCLTLTRSDGLKYVDHQRLPYCTSHSDYTLVSLYGSLDAALEALLRYDRRDGA